MCFLFAVDKLYLSAERQINGALIFSTGLYKNKLKYLSVTQSNCLYVHCSLCLRVFVYLQVTTTILISSVVRSTFTTMVSSQNSSFIYKFGGLRKPALSVYHLEIFVEKLLNITLLESFSSSVGLHNLWPAR